jgi:MFS family permease
VIDAERSLAHPGWRVAAAGSVAVFFAALVMVTFPVLLKPLSAEFGWSREQVSAAFAIAAGTAALLAAPLGALLDRIDARRVVVPALAAFGCAFAALALLTKHLAQLYAMFALLGGLGIAISPVAWARTVSSWFTERRGLALATVVAGGAVGGMLHPPLLEALIGLAGWRAALAILGLAALVLGVPLAARWLRAPPLAAARSGAAAEGVAFGDGLRSLPFWILALCILCSTSVQNSVLVHLHALLTDRGFDPARAALALSLMAASAVAGRLVTGWVIDRFFAARVGSILLLLAAAGAFLLASSRGFAGAVLGAALVAFGTGGEADIVPYLLSRGFGLRSFSALYGAAWMAGGIGGGLGPVLLGRAFDNSGSYDDALFALGVVALIATLAMLALPRAWAQSLG